MAHLPSSQASLLAGPDDRRLRHTNLGSSYLLIPGFPPKKTKFDFTNYIPCEGPTFDPLLKDWSKYIVVDDEGEISERGAR